jgi:ion channel/transposase-like zinc ribbon protein
MLEAVIKKSEETPLAHFFGYLGIQGYWPGGVHFPITELLDDSICLLWLERHLHPDGFACPHCHSRERRLFRQQGDFPAYRCRMCDGYYTLLTNTVFAKTRQRPATLVLLLRGIAKGEPTARLARELGLALVQWGLGSPLQAPDETVGLRTHVYLSGTTFFTLGLGDVTPRTPLARLLTVSEAGIGFGFLAGVIGYLPVLYQAFSRREVIISLLAAERERSGRSPPGLRRRHARGVGGAGLPLVRCWEGRR